MLVGDTSPIRHEPLDLLAPSFKRSQTVGGKRATADPEKPGSAFHKNYDDSQASYIGKQSVMTLERLSTNRMVNAGTDTNDRNMDRAN